MVMAIRDARILGIMQRRRTLSCKGLQYVTDIVHMVQVRIMVRFGIADLWEIRRIRNPRLRHVRRHAQPVASVAARRRREKGALKP